MSLPEEYLIKMKELLKDEFDDYIKSFEFKRYFGLRANTLKIGADKLKNILDIDLEPIKWCKEGFYYNENERPAKHPYYNAGLYYIQEPSAMSTGAMIDIKEGDKVLDLCAAPGGKSTQIGAKLKNTGILISNDISTSRCKALVKNIEVSGIKNAVITNETPEKLKLKFKNYFNKIVVDAPCSGEGMFRKDADIIKSWKSDKTEICNIQKNILKNASEMLCEGGIIAYSTCTFSPEENEYIIDDFIKNNDDFEIIDVAKNSGFDFGVPKWVENGIDDLKKCGRLWPYKIKGEGHFLALLKKKGEYVNIESEKCVEIKNKNLDEYYKFSNEYLNINIDKNLVMHKNSLYNVPFDIDLDGLRVIRSGFYLGDIKTKRFEPSQSFAMGIKKEDAKNVINFNLNEENLIRYLKGESFLIDADEGFNIICVDGFTLGWGKVQNGRLKNKYLPSWRI